MIPATTQARWMKQGYCPWPLRSGLGKNTKNIAYSCWENMVQRCTNPKAKKFENYGGKGISVYPGWRHSFSAFIEHIGPRPSKEYSIDRIDVLGNYEPGNVRWATAKEQAANKRMPKGIEKHGRKYRFDFQNKQYVFDSYDEAMKKKQELYNYK